MCTFNTTQVGWTKDCEQDHEVKCHNFKDKEQKVKTTIQFRGTKLGCYTLQLPFIVSEKMCYGEAYNIKINGHYNSAHKTWGWCHLVSKQWSKQCFQWLRS